MENPVHRPDLDVEEPLVSIITPLYNAENFVTECIKSVQAQSYQKWEMIIVDDCSSDNSFQVVKVLADHESRIRLFQLKRNSGSGPARNRAIKEAQGAILAFLDSDDIWHPEKLKTHLSHMLRNKAAFSHTSYGYLSEEGVISPKMFQVTNGWISYHDLLKRTEISCLTAMYDVRKTGKVYMPDLRRKQDYALWLEILKRGHESLGVQECLAWYRQRKGSATSKKYKLIIKHIQFLRQTQGLNALHAVYYTFYWMINGIFRYFL